MVDIQNLLNLFQESKGKLSHHDTTHFQNHIAEHGFDS